MFSFLSRPRRTTAHINGQPITVEPKETLLQAALRHGVDFPHSCRVGGCASCKCRLLDGKVRELTDSGYVLSEAELDRGYILACQSVPRTDVSVELAASGQLAARRVNGRVIAQERLTHDITHLRVQLDEALPYRAGQYANIGLSALGAISRSYSFAAPARPDGQTSFFVRRAPGGVFSSFVDEQDLVGQAVRVEGPHGDFMLRPADAPLLLVAGGSGLAPLLAILQEALAAGLSRPATLLFGAREQRDLYALDEIAAIAREWRGGLRFLPVLSAADDDISWAGERGLVGAKIPAVLGPGAHAYLCGPPPMIDSALAVLQQAGVAREHIHTDRFLTQHESAARAA